MNAPTLSAPLRLSLPWQLLVAARLGESLEPPAPARLARPYADVLILKGLAVDEGAYLSLTPEGRELADAELGTPAGAQLAFHATASAPGGMVPVVHAGELPAWVDDGEYVPVPVTSVRPSEDGASAILGLGGWSLGVTLTPGGPQPEAGDVALQFGAYSAGNNMLRGLVIERGQDSFALFYEAQAEYAARVQAERDAERAQRDAVAAEKAHEYAARLALLPEPFQARVARFRAGQPRFDAEFLPYELACLELSWAMVQATRDLPGRDAALADLDELQRLTPHMTWDEYSGNMVHFARSLAQLYHVRPELTALQHGAMTVVVGCREYGCTHPTQADVDAALRAESGAGAGA